MHYIFGYGSLICADSRSRTGISGLAYAVEVSGIARRWSVPVPDYGATALGAHQDDQAHCNGVVFAVDEDNLARFDQREQGYDRVRIDWRQVDNLSQTPLPTHHTLWAYVGTQADHPLPERPILQTYLDVILNGCLAISPDFAERFIDSTTPWQHLHDDRQAPGYPRALADHRRHPDIDALLQRTLPALVSARSRVC
ncbi:gamma-glutamylcyclotransferase family protein [Saccharospirillum impatiens]|uniref:gamma-glutamylcyclotransferase family protein n=1 Tax=Saccharospirillum impatiens TaxID=169438 RepID=UPI00040BDEB4|nr:gamma-glutamylcyclotransferase family protein [Saccharospirillum impatiens]